MSNPSPNKISSCQATNNSTDGECKSVCVPLMPGPDDCTDGGARPIQSIKRMFFEQNHRKRHKRGTYVSKR